MRVTAVALMMCVLVASSAEAAFIRAVSLDPENTEFLFELVMEEDALLVSVVFGISALAVDSADASVSPWQIVYFELEPTSFTVGYIASIVQGFSASVGDIIPLARVHYRSPRSIIGLSEIYVINGRLPGSTRASRLETPIEHLFPARELPEPAPILLLLVAGIVWRPKCAA